MDLTPILNACVQFAALALAFAGSVALAYAGSWWDAKRKALNIAGYDDALQKSLAAAAMKLGALIATKGWRSPEVHDALVSDAADYMRHMFPDTLKKVSAEPYMVEVALQRALPEAVTKLAASPATPDGPVALPVPII